MILEIAILGIIAYWIGKKAGEFDKRNELDYLRRRVKELEKKEKTEEKITEEEK